MHATLLNEMFEAAHNRFGMVLFSVFLSHFEEWAFNRRDDSSEIWQRHFKQRHICWTMIRAVISSSVEIPFLPQANPPFSGCLGAGASQQVQPRAYKRRGHATDYQSYVSKNCMLRPDILYSYPCTSDVGGDTKILRIYSLLSRVKKC